MSLLGKSELDKINNPKILYLTRFLDGDDIGTERQQKIWNFIFAKDEKTDLISIINSFL